MIELIINDVSLDLSDRTQIGLTILSSDITNLTTRTGDFTNTFTVPATKRNMKALEHVNLMTSSSTLPYRIVRATFKQDGIEIASNAYCVINSVTVDTITLNIFTGNLDFIKELGDMTVAELYANDSSITWSRSNVISGNDDLVFPLIKWREDSTMFATTPSVDARELLPCLRLSSLLDKISDNINYSLLGSFIDSDLKNEIIITPNKFSVDVEEFDLIGKWKQASSTTGTKVTIVEGTGTTTIIRTPFFNTPQSGEFLNNKFSPSVNRFGVLSFNGQLAWGWRATEDYTIFESKKTRNIEIVLKIVDDLGVVYKELQLPTIATKLLDAPYSEDYVDLTIESPLMTFLSARTYNMVVYIKVHQHDNIPSEFESTFLLNYNGVISNDSVLKFQSNGSLVYGNDLKVSNLFDMKVVDVIKEVINSYQIMISTDSYLQQVKFNYLDTLIENKKRAIDWSYKILTLESVGFTVPSLSKRNHLRYKESDTLPNDSNSYFDIENENLQAESNFVKLSSEMTRTFKGYNDETICLINGINSSYEFQNPQWRILELDEKNTPYNVTYSDALGSTTNSSNVPFAIFRNFEYLKNNYFNVIQDISIDAKVVNATVKINSLDLQEVRNDLVPVWIYSAKFNIDGYFHVNKISNYKNNIAQVELIRI
jgi:hypothetical protein